MPPGYRVKNVVSVRPGKVDRFQARTAYSARMAALLARGLMRAADTLRAQSVIGSSLTGRIVGVTGISGQPAIIFEVAGRARIARANQHLPDPEGPWPEGLRLSDNLGHWKLPGPLIQRDAPFPSVGLSAGPGQNAQHFEQ